MNSTLEIPWNLCGLVVVVSGALTAATLPGWIRFCRRVGLVDEPGGRKDHSGITPLAGGLAIASGLLGTLFLSFVALTLGWGWESWTELLRYGMGKRSNALLAVAGSTVLLVVAGLWDDLYELSPFRKLVLQLLAAGIVAMAGVRLTLFVPSVPLQIVITILWITTLVNAFNFLDNMNGLCAGLGVIAGAAFAGVSAIHGQYLVTLLAMAIVGALLGFLPFNFPKARVFLGDSGSHLVGFLLAVISILPDYYTRADHSRVKVLLPALILLIPLADIVQVSITRWHQGRLLWHADHQHLSHRLLRFGMTRFQVVCVLWGVAAFAAAVALGFSMAQS